MNPENKISPAFEPFLAEMGEDDKRDAIVIYEAPPSEGLPPRGRLRELKKRLVQVQQQATIQVAAEIFDDYQEATFDKGYHDEPLAFSTIGSGALPVATVEVTPKTLEALVEQPNVVAILPNQKIHLIQPRKIEYSELFAEESKENFTWGLRQLDIPRLWEKTTGENINVAVLDTGVYALTQHSRNSQRICCHRIPLGGELMHPQLLIADSMELMFVERSQADKLLEVYLLALHHKRIYWWLVC